MRGCGDSGVSMSLDVDGKITSTMAPSLPSAVTTPTKGSTSPSSKIQNLREPVLPNIPPPATTPSPVMSHCSGTEPFNGSISSLQSSSKVESLESFRLNSAAPESSSIPTLVDLSPSDLEMVEPRREPFPQQFLQFVFDNNSSLSEPGKSNSLQRNSGASAVNTSLAQKQGGKSSVVNGTL